MKLKLVVGGVVCRWNIVNVDEATGLYEIRVRSTMIV